MNDEQVTGLPVIGARDGRGLGTIAHAYLDPVRRRVVVFGVLPAEEAPEAAPGALDPTGAAFLAVPRALAYLAVEDVRTVGVDAVMVADASALRDEPPATGPEELVALDALDGRDVATVGGTPVGQMTSVAFDPASFAVTAIEVAQGFVRRRARIPATLVVDLSSDPIVVAAADPAGTGSGADPADEPTTEAVVIERRDGAGPARAESDTTARKRRGKSRKAPLPPRGERRRQQKGRRK